MQLDLQGKSALVTAASFGLGYHCAKALAAEGVQVAICSRDANRIELAAAEIAQCTSSPVFGFSADLSDKTQVRDLISQARSVLGKIDILVLSTGHPPTYPFSKATNEHWSRGIDLILNPAIELTRALLPEMRDRRYGRLVYIGSIFGLEPEVSSVVQSTLRTGLNAFAKCIATEAAADGVTANVICPGYYDTPLIHELAMKYASEANIPVSQVLDSWRDFAPSKKFGKPEDLGALVTFLSSPRGEFVNGTTIVADGGAIRQY